MQYNLFAWPFRPFVHNYRTFVGIDSTVRTKQHSVAHIENLRNTAWT